MLSQGRGRDTFVYRRLAACRAVGLCVGFDARCGCVSGAWGVVCLAIKSCICLLCVACCEVLLLVGGWTVLLVVVRGGFGARKGGAVGVQLWLSRGGSLAMIWRIGAGVLSVFNAL